jgi:hypothetical protein
MIYLVIRTIAPLSTPWGASTIIMTPHEYVEAIFKDKSDAESYIDNFPDSDLGVFRIDERMLQ